MAFSHRDVLTWYSRRVRGGTPEARRFVIGPDERLVLIEPAESVGHAPMQKEGEKESGERHEEGNDDHDRRFKGTPMGVFAPRLPVS
jgi:hypothetical protein